MVRFPKLRPTILTVALAMLLLVLAACASPQNTFDPASDATDSVLTIYIVVTAAASVVGFLVLVAMAWLLIKYRKKDGVAARQIHGHTGLEIAWTIAPILVLLIIGFPTMFWIAGTSGEPGEDAVHINAVGHQWWFEFQYPNAGPDGETLYTANELHIPVGREIAITLESDDVIHSFWIPRLVGKTDMNPGLVNELQKFTAYEVGEYYGQCVEFCGSAHALMRFRVFVDSQADYDAYLAGLAATPAEPEPGTPEANGKQLFATCAGCHAISGVAGGRVGPDLTLFGERTTLAAGIADNTDANLREWIGDVRSLKPIPDRPGFMPAFEDQLSERDIYDIAAYLKSLTLQ